MTIDADALRRWAVRPALEHLGMWSEAAENLVLGTAAHESGGFGWRTQAGGGPALGLWQIEPATLSDLYANFLAYHGRLLALLTDLRQADVPRDIDLRDNDRYGAGCCMLLYARHHAPLPVDPNDIPALAAFYKRWFNTPEGAATEKEFADDYRRYVLREASAS